MILRNRSPGRANIAVTERTTTRIAKCFLLENQLRLLGMPAAILTFCTTGLSPCPQGRTCPSLGITPSCLTPQIPTDQENPLLSLPLEQFHSCLLFFFFPSSRNFSKHQIKVSRNLYNITHVQSFIWQ